MLQIDPLLLLLLLLLVLKGSTDPECCCMRCCCCWRKQERIRSVCRCIWIDVAAAAAISIDWPNSSVSLLMLLLILLLINALLLLLMLLVRNWTELWADRSTIDHSTAAVSKRIGVPTPLKNRVGHALANKSIVLLPFLFVHSQACGTDRLDSFCGIDWFVTLIFCGVPCTDSTETL